MWKDREMNLITVNIGLDIYSEKRKFKYIFKDKDSERRTTYKEHEEIINNIIEKYKKDNIEDLKKYFCNLIMNDVIKIDFWGVDFDGITIENDDEVSDDVIIID